MNIFDPNNNLANIQTNYLEVFIIDREFGNSKKSLMHDESVSPMVMMEI